MRYLLAFLLICILLAGCATVGLDSIPGPEPNASPVPSTMLTVQDSPVTSTPVPTATAPRNPLITNPWDAAPNLDLLQLSEGTQKQIKEDYCQTLRNCTADQVELTVLGVFGDTYALFVDVYGMMYAQAITVERVGGFDFWYSCLHTMDVYHDGAFYGLQEAFDADLLTEADLQILFDNYYGAYPHLWALYYEVDE